MGIYDFDMVYDHVHKDGFFSYFRQQYHILTKDHAERYLYKNVDCILDIYSNHIKAMYSPNESIAIGVQGTLDVLVQDFNEGSCDILFSDDDE